MTLTKDGQDAGQKRECVARRAPYTRGRRATNYLLGVRPGRRAALPNVKEEEEAVIEEAPKVQQTKEDVTKFKATKGKAAAKTVKMKYVSSCNPLEFL